MVCATSKSSDQPAHRRSLIRAFACRLNILTVKLLTEVSKLKKDAAQAHLSNSHIVGNHMPQLYYLYLGVVWLFHLLWNGDQVLFIIR